MPKQNISYIDAWYLILESIPPNHISITYFLRLAAVSREARFVFMSDRAWRALNPYGLEHGIAKDFFRRLEQLTPIQKKELYLVWEDSGSRWDWHDYYHEHGRPYGVPDNLYHRLAVVAYVENNYDFVRETDYNLMSCAVQLNPASIRKVSPDIPGYAELVRKAVTLRPSLLRDMPQDIRQNAEIMFTALVSERCSVDSILACGGELLADSEFARRVKRLDEGYIGYFGVVRL